MEWFNLAQKPQINITIIIIATTTTAKHFQLHLALTSLQTNKILTSQLKPQSPTIHTARSAAVSMQLSICSRRRLTSILK